MNVYEKLAKARVMFQENNPKMSGKNTYAGYTYFELSDILPVINKIGAEIGFVCEVSFTKDESVLLFRNTEKTDESICFHSPMSTASLKGCHEVQNLGAVQTYLKRYLYQNCFEIVEADPINGGEVEPPTPKAPAQKQTPKPAVHPDQVEFENLQKALIDYLNDGDVEYFEHPENVRAVIASRNLNGMRQALKVAKDVESKINKQTAPVTQPEQFPIF